MRNIVVLVALVIVSAHSAIIDRIAVSVGNQVITADEVLDEIRTTAFLNGATPDFSAQSKKEAAGRLVDQTLIRREMDVSHYPVPQLSEAEPELNSVAARYANREAFNAALKKYRITEADLMRHLLWQLTVLKFIDERFRPSVQITNGQLRRYYDAKVKQWKEGGAKDIPTLEQSRAALEKALTEERINSALDRWLGDARTQVDIRYHEEALS